MPADGPTLEPTAVTRDPEWLREQYGRGFERISRAIDAGEIYQANLTRAIDLPFTDDARACYLALRARQAVPYGAFLDLGTFAIVSNSPECFLDIAGEHIATYPIKGTRPRSNDAVVDAAAVAALTRDPKELAEHVMIVDLERNDLGRLCATGSVEVTEHARVLSLATVHHLVSKVRGRLRSDASHCRHSRRDLPRWLRHRRTEDPGHAHHRRGRADARAACTRARSAASTARAAPSSA